MDAQNPAVLLPALEVFAGAHEEELMLRVVPIAANAFKYVRSIMQGMGQDSDARLAQRHILPVEIHNQVRIRFSLHGKPPGAIPAKARALAPARAHPASASEGSSPVAPAQRRRSPAATPRWLRAAHPGSPCCRLGHRPARRRRA